MLRSLPRRIEQVRLSTSSLFVLPSPVNGRVGIHDFTFGACSSFTHVAACQIACPPIADFCPEAPTQPVTRLSRSVATMLIDVYMDGSSSHWRSAPLRRTVNGRVRPVVRVLDRPIFPHFWASVKRSSSKTTLRRRLSRCCSLRRAVSS